MAATNLAWASWITWATFTTQVSIGCSIASLFTHWEVATAHFAVVNGISSAKVDVYTSKSLFQQTVCTGGLPSTFPLVYYLGAECKWVLLPSELDDTFPRLDGGTEDNYTFKRYNSATTAFVVLGVALAILAQLVAVSIKAGGHPTPGAPLAAGVLMFLAACSWVVAFPIYERIIAHDRGMWDDYASSAGYPTSLIVAPMGNYYVRQGPGYALAVIAWVVCIFATIFWWAASALAKPAAATGATASHHAAPDHANAKADATSTAATVASGTIPIV